MGNTASGLWYPEKETPIGSLHTLLAQMQESVETMRTALKTELTDNYPVAGAYSTGTPQQTAGGEIYMTGGSNGWVVGQYNPQAEAAGISIHTGVRDTPLTVTQGGTYAVSLHCAFLTNANTAFVGQAFTDIVFGGTLNTERRSVWTGSAMVSSTEILNIPAGSTGIALQTYTAEPGQFVVAEITVFKLR